VQSHRQTPSSIPSLITRKHLIDEHILANGGFESLDASVERPRFLLLLDACHREDFFFVALHQLFCLWAVDPSAVLQIDGFQDQQLVGYAFQLVAKLIRGNEGLSPIHLKWFTEFPSPLNHLLARSDQYRGALSAVRFFLGKLRTEKSSMIQECQQRGFPPLVDEMVHRLGLLSPVLQGVFFTASRRTLGVRDEVVGPQMERLFLQDREAHERLAARINTNFPPSENELRERHVWLAQQYLLLRNNSPRPEPRPSKQQKSMSARQAVHTPGSESFANPPPSPNAPHLDYDNNASLQSSGLARALQSPRSQSIDAPDGPVQYAPPIGQAVYQNLQRAASFPLALSSQIPSQQLPEQGLATQMPQPHVRNNASQMAQPTLRSNHNQIPANQTASNIYPGALMSTYMQPNPLRQQTSVVSSQQTMVPSPNYSQQQFQPQGTRQRQASGAGAEQNVQSLRRINSIPALGPVPQGPISGVRIMNPHMVRSMQAEGPRRPDHVARQNSAKGSWQVPIIPRLGESLPSHAPNPDMTALHQAVLRSPYLVPIDKPLDLVPDDPAGRYYQAVVDFAVGPVPLPRDCPLRIENFIVPIDTYARVPKDKLSADAPPIRHVQRGSLQYRMRCIQARRNQPPRPSDFVVADTAWPATIFMEFNGMPIEVRRKLHHGRDLPVDITPYIHSIANNIINQVKISVPSPKAKDDIDYYFAVEIVEVLQHQQIINMSLGRRIAAEETINNIKKSLSGSFIDDDDDEISMVVGDLTINLADPFMARIFEIPVRGSGCLHRECFDLQTFLNTRNSKPKMPQQPSMVDVWRCPLCGKDARPYSLQVDDLLVSVRECLARSNELHTKAIVISADGTWKPKPETLPSKRSASRAGLDDDDLYASDDDGIKKSEMPARNKSSEVEVIELDD
jgi:zinc finger MIZ domain-containing protein